jgi:hypothetical protein
MRAYGGVMQAGKGLEACTAACLDSDPKCYSFDLAYHCWLYFDPTISTYPADWAVSHYKRVPAGSPGKRRAKKTRDVFFVYMNPKQ